MNEEQDGFYVEIPDSAELRKSLLLSSKQTIHTLKKYKDYVIVRNKKKQATSDLLISMQKIRELTTALQSKLPKSKVKFQEKKT